MTEQQLLRIAVVVVLLLAVGCWPATQALAMGAAAAQAAPVGTLQADFNNDGADDLAVGVPGENVGSIVDAGSVNVLYGSPGTGLVGVGSQLFTQPVSAVEAGDQFGSALASGDFNNDGFADLAAGAVSAVAESTGGLLGGGLLFTQDTAGVPSAAENEDFFGWALASGDSGPASTAASPSSATASSASRAQSGGGSLGRLFA